MRQQDLFGSSPPDTREPGRDGRADVPLPITKEESAKAVGIKTAVRALILDVARDEREEQQTRDVREHPRAGEEQVLRKDSAPVGQLQHESSKRANLTIASFTPSPSTELRTRSVEARQSDGPAPLDSARDERLFFSSKSTGDARAPVAQERASTDPTQSTPLHAPFTPNGVEGQRSHRPTFLDPARDNRSVSLAEVAAQRGSWVRDQQEPRTEPARVDPTQRKNGEAPKVRIAPRVLSVSELTKQIKETLEPSFSRVIVRGEISGFKGPNSRGHWYFALKDAWAQVDARVWESTAKRLKFTLKDGMEVIAEGNLDLYPPQGRYALIVQKLEPAGVGAQALALEQLKAKLMAEGLFGDRRKKPRRPLPVIPKRIGVVTSVTGAALRDFVKVLFRRHPHLSVLVAHARVQGDGAAIDIEGGVRRLARTDCDVIVVTRGGGSMEDLWAFNDERVVRAIFDSPVPVISAVGHEVDVTLADFVADHRAATPSHAAEALAPVLSELELQLAQRRQRLHKAVERSLLGQRAQLDRLARKLADPRRGLSQHRIQLSEWSDRLVSYVQRTHRERSNSLRDLERRISRASPQARLKQVRGQFQSTSTRLHRVATGLSRTHRNRLETLKSRLMAKEPRAGFRTERVHLKAHRERMIQLVRNQLARQRDRIHMLERRLDSLSPLKVLARGYSITRLEDGRVVRSGEEAPAGTLVRILLNSSDQLEARVERTLKENVLPVKTDNENLS